ncbi:RHS repeat-associated core domain-containing protein [Victivallis sp. Marseille-Q1083]|uniref:RHS repeat-associated core domain-containing protein n=1 Tax=Victivallis sp. Marseille-Q1083 TaxID=2717288 RepID=UPI001C3785B9|nr:RHS repeat-associated core domain-containing protein [Victivallis sp. Marseille-Q1083]
MILKSGATGQTRSEVAYVYDGWNVVGVYDTTTAAPTSLKGYLWGEDLSGSLQGAGGVGGLLSEKRGGQTYLPVYDGNGNIMSYLNAPTKASVAEYIYDAFGRTISSSGAEADNFTYRFSTKSMDGNGLYYYGYRYYDPQHGRWISRDPIEENGGVNLYGMVENCTINKFDINGLAWKIERDKKSWANATREFLEDDFKILSELVKLEHSELKKWLKNEDGSEVSDKDLETKCNFKVPNTMIVYTTKSQWGDGWLAFVTQLKLMAVKSGNNYRKKNYLVIEHKWASSESLFISLWETDGIVAFAFAGHGSTAGFNSEPTSIHEVNTSSWDVNPPYKLQAIGAYTCFSSTRHFAGINADGTPIDRSWKDLISSLGTFLGFSGAVNYFTASYYLEAINIGYDNIP